jgi:hypothetical protein
MYFQVNGKETSNMTVQMMVQLKRYLPPKSGASHDPDSPATHMPWLPKVQYENWDTEMPRFPMPPTIARLVPCRRAGKKKEMLHIMDEKAPPPTPLRMDMAISAA